MENISKATLQEHQAVLYELLQVFANICQKHQIKYMLFAGTALGAVRHKGFIPWDDDLDVVMLRSEYDRFMEVAEQELDVQKYFLQKEFTEHWPMFFSKLRKNNTTCLERFVPRDLLTHQGIYIDIFPCDILSDNPLLCKLQFLASKVVIAKSLDKRGYRTKSIFKKGFMVCCRLLPQKPFLKFVQRRGEKETMQVHTFFGAASHYEKNIYPRKWFQDEIYILFENEHYPVSAWYEELLKKLYGDYMIPLPKEKRASKVHAEFVDVNHSYEEYLEYQQALNFTEYSRSIR